MVGVASGCGVITNGAVASAVAADGTAYGAVAGAVAADGTPKPFAGPYPC